MERARGIININEIELRYSPPSPAAYFDLFETTGWNRGYQASADDLAQVLANSQFLIAAYHGERLVGFGRIVSDGVLHAMIYDMIVHPEYQGCGVGTAILQKLIEWCEQAHIRDIQLFCAQGKRQFYERNGFAARPEEAPGMQYRRS